MYDEATARKMLQEEAVLVSAEDTRGRTGASLDRSYEYNFLRVETSHDASFCKEGGYEDVPLPDIKRGIDNQTLFTEVGPQRTSLPGKATWRFIYLQVPL